MYAFTAYIEKSIIRNKVLWEYEAFIDEVTVKLVVPAVMEVLLLDQISNDVWQNWVASAKVDDVVILLVLVVLATRMFGLLFLTLLFCAMELALY